MNGMPEGFRVFITRMNGPDGGGFHEHRPRSMIFNDVDSGNYYIVSTFFVVERVAFHAIYGVEDAILDELMVALNLRYEVFKERMIWPANRSTYEIDSIRYSVEDIIILNSLFAPVPGNTTTVFDSTIKK
jgi:hypothetical protein